MDNNDPLGLKDASSKKQLVKKRAAKVKESKLILYLENSLSDTRGGQRKNMEARVKDAGYEFAALRLEGKFPELLDGWVKENNKKPAAILRWEEHGVIFGRHSNYKALSKWAYENDVAPLTVDFAYFNHYGGYMVDLLNEKGEPSTRAEMLSMSDDCMEIDEIKGKVGEYIQLIKKIYDRHRFYSAIGHSKTEYKFAALTQSLMNGCRLLKTNSPKEWMTKVQEVTSGDVLFKTQPAAFVKKSEDLNEFRSIDHRGLKRVRKIKEFGMEVNAAVAMSSECCIINSSGVSSEFIISGLPVIATGESWFNNLMVFHEPKTWEDMKDMIDNQKYDTGPTRKIMRKKWVNWWLKHQFLDGEPTTIIQDSIKEFKDRTG
jgi:hypothetical protein